ncbi:PQQ-binding-like beta-propeller repeat protein [Actinosynnema pretiosum subsp. pretiosum]|uniref:PQQ-binding-like beta-propeller repeat protein n=1 Tax=Actinosynnema pretiosum subsp. pretiosum TaxID=103721 RepID=A0AA45R6W6_9PSEU|nr:hypothetical protein APASM_0782 [Actinosynnema pretiosum subsp. pretiosum]QUF07472.1 PQQ-binding-like beta-propeller repeat protein [Actinosynnema pretiosum subsp. pretiosum]
MVQPEQAESDGRVVPGAPEEDVLRAPGGVERPGSGEQPGLGERSGLGERPGFGEGADLGEGAGPAGGVGPDEPVPPPSARPWRTRRDYAAVALVVVGALLGGLLVWLTSDVRATTSQTGPSELPALPEATALPPSLSEVWRAASPATPGPVVANGVVVTGEGGEVVGRDPLTGDVRWRYGRDLPLCTVGTAWNRPFAVHTKGTNCSEVTSLDAASGARGPQRDGDAELGTRLLNEGSHVVVTGERYFEVYRRDDLVRSMEYGQLRAIVNPNKQPRTNCTYGSFAVTGGKVAVLERCPDLESGDRVTVLKPNPEKSDEPGVITTVSVGATGARVIAVTANRVAVAAAGKLVLFDAQTGGLISEIPVEVSEAELAGDPPGRVAATYHSTANVYWYTGSRTIALSLDDLTPRWTREGTVGAGTSLAGKALLPVAEGLVVLDQVTGEEIGSIPVNRGGYGGDVVMATNGPVVLEQRGGELVALR